MDGDQDPDQTLNLSDPYRIDSLDWRKEWLNAKCDRCHCHWSPAFCYIGLYLYSDQLMRTFVVHSRFECQSGKDKQWLILSNGPQTHVHVYMSLDMIFPIMWYV